MNDSLNRYKHSVPAPVIPGSAGVLRVWYLEHPGGRSMRFALELNAMAIDDTAHPRAAALFDEAADVLQAHIAAHGLSLEFVLALGGVLRNRCALRDLFDREPADVLAEAVDAGQRAVMALRVALPERESLATGSGAAMLTASLAETLAQLSRALAQSGDSENAKTALFEARAIAALLRQDAIGTGNDGDDDALTTLDELIADANRAMSGEALELRAAYWYRSPLTA